MGQIIWKESYCVGVEQIDHEHQQMIEMINEVYTLIKDGDDDSAAREVIRKMRNYVETHFSTEESLMRKHEYDGSTGHIAEHNYFTTKVETLEKEYEADGGINPVEVHRFLSGWMIGHILSCDKDFGRFLQNMGEI